MKEPASEVRIERPVPGDWSRMLEILATARYDRIGGAEMPSFPLADCFVARTGDGAIVGVAGYRMLDAQSAKTTLMAVDPAFRGRGIGQALQRARMNYLRSRGIRRLFTNCDDEQVIRWYEKHFGYRRTGERVRKVEPFGLPDRHEWITLVVDLLPGPRSVLLNACLTGMVGTKARNPFLPVTPEEIVRDALAVAREQAAIVHVHARDPAGRPTWSAEIYREILRGIRAGAPDLIVCVSTSGRLWSDRQRRSEVLRLDGPDRPDMASLTLGSVRFPQGESVNKPEDICFLAEVMKDSGIRPELEIFDTAMADFMQRLADQGMISPPFYVNIILGNRFTAPATDVALEEIVRRLPAGSVWAAAGIGRTQYVANRLALERGGGARVGLEDNLYLDPEAKTPATNADLVQRTAQLARELGCTMATPAEARAWLALPDR